MKLIQGNRGDGITTQLILESAQFNIPILTPYLSSARLYEQRAKEMGLKIPEPIVPSACPHIRGMRDGQDILIDSGIALLHRLLADTTGVDFNIKTFGYTDGMDEKYAYKHM